MEFENWKIEKGVYNPPVFDNVYHRKIKISPYIHSKIQHIIGKDGKNFIDITSNLEGDVLYSVEIGGLIWKSMNGVVNLNFLFWNPSAWLRKQAKEKSFRFRSG